MKKKVVLGSALVLLVALMVPSPARVTAMVFDVLLISSVMLVGEMERLPAALAILQLTLFAVVVPSLQR